MQAESDGLNKRIANLERAILRRKVASRLRRIQAIHLWKRCRKNANQALQLAKTQKAQSPGNLPTGRGRTTGASSNIDR